MVVFFNKKIKALMQLINIKKCFGMITCIFAILSFFSLVKYKSSNLSWFYYDSAKPFSGSFSYLLANIAGSLLYIFGAGSLLFVCILFFVSFFLLNFISFKKEWERFFGFVLLIISMSVLAQINKSLIYNNSFWAGGIFGNFILNYLLKLFDKNLIFVFVYSSLWIAFILISRFSFLHVYRALMPNKLLSYKFFFV